MIEPTKEQLAEALREYPSWGHAYVAEKARADGLEEQLETLRQERDDERRRAINAETRLIALQRGKL